MTTSPEGSTGSSNFDFDALYRGESPADGVAPVTTPPWDNKEPSESVIGWLAGGWIHGDILDIGCGLGDNAIYLAKNGYPVTGLDISSTALSTARQRADDAGVEVTFAVADSTKLDGYTAAFASPSNDDSARPADQIGLDTGGAFVYLGIGYTYRFDTPFGQAPFVTLE